MTHNSVMLVDIHGLLIMEDNIMRRILFYTIFTIFLMDNSVNAEMLKSSKNLKQSESNKSDEALMAEFMKSVQQEKEADNRIKESKTKILTLEKEAQALNKLEKTVDEVGKQLHISK
jgi:hypothetical protein